MRAIQYTKPKQAVPNVYTRAFRLTWIDNAKIISAMAIIVGHVSSGALTEMNIIGDHGYNWWIANYFDSLIGWCVQVFIMISGFLLLNPMKDETPLLFYKKRAQRVLIPITFWMLFFIALIYFQSLAQGEPFSIAYIIKLIWFGKVYYHLWFFYIIIGLYLFTPFIRFIVRHASNTELLYLCVGLFAMAMLDRAANSYFAGYQTSMISLWVLYTSYFLTGYLICKTRVLPNTLLLCGIAVLSIFLTGLGNYFTIGADNLENYFFDNFSITRVPLSISIMFLLKKISVPVINPDISRKLATWSLGVCLIHPVFLAIFGALDVKAAFYGNLLFSIPLVVLLVALVSFLSVMLIDKIPVVRKIV
jgi:surface polysaccharide O-acyltransferase-like enzyme